MRPCRWDHDRGTPEGGEGRTTHPISVPSIRYRPSGVKYWLELAPSLQLCGCMAATGAEVAIWVSVLKPPCDASGLATCNYFFRKRFALTFRDPGGVVRTSRGK